MDANTLAVLAGLGSAATYGAGDFSGGLAAKRDPALRVVALSQAAGVALFALAALLTGEAWPSRPDLSWGVGAGLSGAGGALALYRGLAAGPMSLVAPITAGLAALLPILLQVAAGSEAVGPARAAGMALALAGIALVSRSGGAARSGPGGVMFGVLGGLGFGGAFACLARTSPDGLFWPLAAGRAASALLLAAIVWRTRTGLRPLAPLPVLCAIVFDAAANGLYVVAVHTGLVMVSVVFCSLYPAVTVLLAMALLRERPRRAQWAGLAAVVAAIAMIA